MRLVRLAMSSPHAVAVFALATLIIGVTVLGRMPVDILPTFRTPAVQILTFYPGMPAEFVEHDITTRLERWTGQANGVARQESKSMVGVSIVKDFFRPDIDPNTAMSMVSSLAMSDLFYLPPGTIPPMVMPFDPTASTPLALVTVSSRTADETELYDVAYYEMRNRLQSVTGVIAPAVYGGKLRRILAYADRDLLQARGMDLLDVVDGINANNVLVPTGSAKLGNLEYQINASGMVRHVEDFDAIPVRYEAGRPVFVKDVADTEDSSQIQTNIVRIDGRRQVYIPIYRQPGANTIEIVEGVRAQLDDIRTRIPAYIDLDVVMDQSVFVRHSIEQLRLEAVLGAGLAAVMVFFFIGSLRSSAIVLAGLPLAFLMAFVGLSAADQTINTMTLGGLALAVGLVIDQAIVVIENIDRHLGMRKSAGRAALDGATEVSTALLVITVAMVTVFFPVVFLSGIGRFLFTPLALAVAFALTGSYVVAMTVVPSLAGRFLGSGGATEEDLATHGEGTAHTEPTGGRVRRVVARATTGYATVLDWVLARRVLVLVSVAAFVAISILATRGVGTELFPQVDAGQMTIQLRGVTGLRVERTEDLVARVEVAIRDVIPDAEVVKVVSNIGVLLDWPAAYTSNSGSQDAFINLQLSDDRAKSTQDYAAALRAHLTERFPEAEFAFDTSGMLGAALTFGLPSPINVQVEGKDYEVSMPLAEQVRARIARVPGAVDVRVQQRIDAPEIRVEIDRVKAAELGLSTERVVKNIVAALNSSINFKPSFWFDHASGNHYFLGVQYAESEIDSFETLRNIPITSGTGSTDVPTLLRNIATFERGTTVSQSNHVNITRVVDVYANVYGRDVGSVANDIEAAIADLAVPPGYRVRMQGEVASMRQSFSDMAGALALAVTLVYLVMVVLFRSFLDPLIILVAMPLGLTGVVWILWLSGTTLNVQSFMGAMMMTGIAVSGGVLYVEFANRRLAEGLTPVAAVREAGRARLRPILMTSLAAILGLLPMALVPGQATTPLARAVVGGVAVSTLLTLFVVPVLYTYAKARK